MFQYDIDGIDFLTCVAMYFAEKNIITKWFSKLIQFLMLLEWINWKIEWLSSDNLIIIDETKCVTRNKMSCFFMWLTLFLLKFDTFSNHFFHFLNFLVFDKNELIVKVLMNVWLLHGILYFIWLFLWLWPLSYCLIPISAATIGKSW